MRSSAMVEDVDAFCRALKEASNVSKLSLQGLCTGVLEYAKVRPYTRFGGSYRRARCRWKLDRDTS